MKMKKLAMFLAALMAVSGPVEVIYAADTESSEIVFVQQEEDAATENGQEESDEIFFDESEGFDESETVDSDEIIITEGSDEIQISADEETESVDEKFDDEITLETESEAEIATEAAETIVSGDYEYIIDLNTGEAELQKYNGKASSLIIPSSIDGRTVVSIAAGFLKDNATVESLTVPRTVNSCGRYLLSSGFIGAITGAPFMGCETLTSITFEEGTERIPAYMCSKVTNLQSVTIPSSVKYIGHFAFKGCESLAGINLSMDELELGGEVFADTAVTSITLPPKTTYQRYQVNQVNYYPFSGSKIVSVNLRDGMQTLPNYLFGDLETLKSVSIPDSVTKIDKGAFTKCTSLEEIGIPESVKNIEANAFESCSSLSAVSLYDGLESIGNYAFNKCESLMQLEIPDTVTTLGYAVVANTGITEFTFPESFTESVRYVRPKDNSYHYGALGESSVTQVHFKDGMENIPAYACANATVLTEVDMADGVKEIGEYAFLNCSTLTIITLPDKIGKYAFNNCTALKEVTVKKSESSFANAAGLTVQEAKEENPETEDPDVHKLDMAWGITAREDQIIYESAFRNCSALKKITLPVSLRKINASAFYQCNALEEVVYTGTKAQWETVTIGKNQSPKLATPTCTGTESATVPTGFEIQVSTSDSFDKCQKIRVSYQEAYTAQTDAFQTVVTADEKVKTYYVRIRSFRGAGTNSDGTSVIHYGGWTDTVTCTVKNIVSASDVKKSVEKFYTVLGNYLADLKKESEAEKENYESTTTKGEILKNADDGSMVAWLTTSLTDRQKQAVYEALAEYMDSASGMSLGKLPADSNKASQQIMKAIYENLTNNSGEKSYNISGVKVVLKLTAEAINEKNILTGKTEVKSAFSGIALINGRAVATVSSGQSGKVMLAYIKDLRATVNDLMYQSLTSVFTEFMDVTLISQFEKDSTKQWLDGMSSNVENALNKNVGWGKVKKVLTAGWNACKVLNKIKSTSSPKDLKDALKNADEIYKYIEGLNMSDSAIKSDLLKSATMELENQRKDLARTLYCYIYKLEEEDASSTTGKIIQKIRKLKANCPVDIDIYDDAGNLAGSVRNGRARFQPGITLLVKGDTKEFWLATDKNYRIVFTGTGTGTMNYSIQQRENHEFTEQVDYYDVPLTEGIVYEQTIAEGDLKAGQSACDLVVTASGNRVTSTAHKDSDGNVENVKISCTTGEGGSVTGDLEPVEESNGQKFESTVEKSTRIEVKAVPEDGYEFAGWYQNGELISNSDEYYFAAVKDLELEAKFEKSVIYDNDHILMTGNDYKGKLWAGISEIKDEATGKTVKNLQVSFVGEDSPQADTINVILKRYPKAGGNPTTEKITMVKQPDSSYLLEGFDLGNDEKIELVDESGKILTIIYTKNKAPSYSCGDGNHSFGSWKTVKAASAVQAGQKECICTECGAKETAAVAKLPATGKLNITSIPLKVKQSTSVVKVTGLAAGDYVKTYKTANSKIATVNTKGKITAKKKGNTDLIVTLASGKTLKAKIKVQKTAVKTQKLTVDKKKVNLKVKKTLQLKVSKFPLTSLEKVTFTSSNKKVATVSKTGKITAKKAGKAKITVKAGKKKVTVNVVVKK